MKGVGVLVYLFKTPRRAVLIRGVGVPLLGAAPRCVLLKENVYPLLDDLSIAKVYDKTMNMRKTVCEQITLSLHPGAHYLEKLLGTRRKLVDGES